MRGPKGVYRSTPARSSKAARPPMAARPSRAAHRSPSARWSAVALTLTLALALTATPHRARAQLTDPCSLGCGLTLGASSFVFATGTMTAMGRLQGGFSRKGPAIVSWGTGFVVAAGAGLALHDDGGRQRRAVYGSALGAAAGALTGLAARSLVGESSAAERVAATLVGAAVGVAAGGLVGALSYDDPTAAEASFTVVGPTFTIPVGH